MIRRLQLITALTGLSIAATTWVGHVNAQSTSAPERSGLQALRRQVERRFEPFPLIDGFALRPKTPMRGIRSIEVTGGTIAVDGSPVTGVELRNRIGDDADLVIQLSYLGTTERRALFAGASPAASGPAPFEPQPAPPLAERPDGTDRPDRAGRRDRRGRLTWPGDNRVNIGGSVSVGPDEVVEGDVVAVGGSAHVEGQVHGDVVAVGGSVDLGPHAIVDQDVAVIGGSLRRAEGSRVGGNIKEVGIGTFNGDWIAPRTWVSGWVNRGLGSTFALLSTVTRGAVLCLLAALVVLLAGASVDQISLRAAAEPLKAGAIGLLAQVLFLPLLVITILVLVVTIVGIPLLVLIPFVVLGLGVVGLVGFTAVAHRVGEHAGRRLGWTNPGSYLTTFAGVIVILFPVLLARLALLAGGTGVALLWHGLAAVGLLVEYLAWTVGFGAVALVRFGRKAAIG
jgi:hypothetical protein